MQGTIIVGLSLLSGAFAGWVHPNVPIADWKHIAASPSGNFIIAVNQNFGSKGIYSSGDGGTVWYPVTISHADDSNSSWVSVAASSASSFALQEGAGLFVSKNNWKLNKIDTSITNPQWSQVACDYFGQNVVVTQNNAGIYFSKDGGNTFTKVLNSNDYSWGSLAVSYYGNQIMAVRATNENAIVLHNSQDFGATWKVIGTSQSYTSVFYAQRYASYVFATVAPSTTKNNEKGGIYVSANAGVSWVLSEGTDNYSQWISIVSDSMGRYVTAAVAGGNIYVSSDYGVTFTQSSSAPTNKNWTALTINKDGTRITGATSGPEGTIYYTWKGKE